MKLTSDPSSQEVEQKREVDLKWRLALSIHIVTSQPGIHSESLSIKTRSISVSVLLCVLCKTDSDNIKTMLINILMTKHHNVKLLQENNMGSQLKLYGK